VADLARFLVVPGSDVLVRACLARSPARTLDELIDELLWSARAHGFKPFAGGELAGGRVRLGRPSDEWLSVQQEPPRGFLCDVAVWPELLAAFWGRRS